MAQPHQNNVHINRPLTNISVAFVQDQNAFAAGRVFPIVPVESKSDSYFVFPRANFNRNDFARRQSGAESAGTGFVLADESYNCKRYDLHHDLTDDVIANTDSPLNLDRTTTEFLTEQSLINREVNFNTNYMSQNVWSIEEQGVDSGAGSDEFIKWSDDASDPVEDVLRVKRRVLLLTGRDPNKITIARDVYDVLKTNASVIDRIKYSGGTSNDTPVRVTENALAAVFEVDEIIVSSAVINTANENATAANEFIIAGKVLLAYAPKAAGLMIPSAGYIFNWRGLLGNNEAVRVKRFRMEHLEADRIEMAMAYDMKKVSEAAGLLYDVV